MLLNRRGDLLNSCLVPSGTDYALTAKTLRDRLLAEMRLTSHDVEYVVATGHNVRLSWANEYATDIQCCARGVHAACPSARTVIDIQAQTTQVIRLSESGLVANFVVSEKCAAGSGRFLDVVANVLQVKLEDIGPLSLRAKNPVAFSTGCAVFGESEAISRVAEGMVKEDILAGVHRSVAHKIAALVVRAGMEEPCAAAGGGALNQGLLKAIEESLGIRALLLPPHPELIGAVGAAALAEERNRKAGGVKL